MRAICAGLLLAAGAVQAATGNGLQARDINGDGTVDAYYDPAQGVSFAADANLAVALGWQSNDPAQPGSMQITEAQGWAASLNFYGVTGWRLPRVTSFTCTDGGDGMIGECNPSASELSALPAFASFSNVQSNGYWLADVTPDCGCWNQGHWTFFVPATGHHGNTDEGNLDFFAWAVHDGDIGSPPAGILQVDPPPVPEPSTWAALLGGLAVMGTTWRRRTPASRRSAQPSWPRTRARQCQAIPGLA